MDYKIIETIYDGSHSTVNKIETSHRLMAMKTIKLTRAGVPDNALREMTLLKKFNHQHIIQYHDVLINLKNIHIILEYCDCHLTDYYKNLSHYNILNIFNQICLGVSYLHQQQIMHRDLKPDNILVKNNIVKIADFGLARYTTIKNCEYSYQVVTLPYRAPEIIKRLNYSLPIDIWSLGCILYEMVTHQLLFDVTNEYMLLNKINNLNLNNIHLLHIIEPMLIIDMNHRITINQLMDMF